MNKKSVETHLYDSAGQQHRKKGHLEFERSVAGVDGAAQSPFIVSGSSISTE